MLSLPFILKLEVSFVFKYLDAGIGLCSGCGTTLFSLTLTMSRYRFLFISEVRFMFLFIFEVRFRFRFLLTSEEVFRFLFMSDGTLMFLFKSEDKFSFISSLLCILGSAKQS